MRRALLMVAVGWVLVCSANLRAAEPATLTVKAVLVDEQLNQKPVPRLEIGIENADVGMDTVKIRTNFDGIAQTKLMPGRYVLTTEAPAKFGGKAYRWSELVDLKTDTTLEWSNDNAAITVDAVKPARVVDELSKLFAELQNGVVTVWSEIGHGSGFIVDDAGLVVTNDHVVSRSRTNAVQFDATRKVRAEVIASDPDRDIAILRIAPHAFEGAIALKIAKASDGEATLVEGERVFTIGSPLSQRKIITSGIVSKIEPHAIISDVNINHGNSGGPLFNSVGEVVGVTTFGDLPANGGPGISGVIRIEDVRSLLTKAKAALAEKEAPSSALLPVEPLDTFPLDAIKSAITAEKFDLRSYQYGIGGFDVLFSTPVVLYRIRKEAEVEAAQGKARRNRRSAEAVQGTFNPAADLRLWEEYVGEYKPMLLVRARPQLREGFWSAFGRGLAMSQGMYGGPANMAFQADFYEMKLTCGGKEVVPIQPAKAPIVINEDNAFVRIKDATFEGAYFYAADAVRPDCGVVQLQLFTEKKPNEPILLNVRIDTVLRIWSDFEPYRKAMGGRATSN